MAADVFPEASCELTKPNQPPSSDGRSPRRLKITALAAAVGAAVVTGSSADPLDANTCYTLDRTHCCKSAVGYYTPCGSGSPPCPGKIVTAESSPSLYFMKANVAGPGEEGYTGATIVDNGTKTCAYHPGTCPPTPGGPCGHNTSTTKYWHCTDYFSVAPTPHCDGAPEF